MVAMTAGSNPFRATLGSTPPYLAGRHDQIAEFADALDDGPGAHERVSLITGLRGVGKTVLLNAFEQEARARSWWVISESATPGFSDRIVDELLKISSERSPSPTKRISGLSVAGLAGVQFDNAVEHRQKPSLRNAISDFLASQSTIDQKFSQEPVGLLITLDELHYQQHEEVINFGTTIQHLVRENCNVAVAMAGIPQSIQPLLASDKGRNPVTFLRRANRIVLGLVDHGEVEEALSTPLSDTDVAWDPEALTMAVRACGGYPFLIQLVGHQCFRRREGNLISVTSAMQGASAAKRKMGQLVHEPALRDLSNVDRTFLAAMAIDDGPSKISDVAQRLGVSSQYASNYRRRLLDAEMIKSVGYGTVDFELPYLREYLRSHTVTDALGHS